MGDDAQHEATRELVAAEAASSEMSLARGDERLDMHKPESVYSWRGFLSEIGVVVIGVLIALAAEQVVESLNWREKVNIAKDVVDLETRSLLFRSYEATQLNQCTKLWIDSAEAAIKRHDAAALQILFDGQPPFQPRNWRSTAWQTLMSTQVADHLDKTYLNKQAFLFTSFEDIRMIQPSLLDGRAEVLTGRLGIPDQGAEHSGLIAAERLRSQLMMYNVIADTVQRQAKGTIISASAKRKVSDKVAACKVAAAKADRSQTRRLSTP